MKKATLSNRLLSLVLCLCMVLGLMPGIPLLAQAAGTEGMITIEMNDIYGDGWSGNGIEIYADDVLLHTATIDAGYEAVWTQTMDPHITYVFKWIEGEYPGEVSFVIYRGTEELINTNAYPYHTGDVILTMEETCAGTSYDESFCCLLCGLPCNHGSFTENVCNNCGFICGTSGPHAWESGVCTKCSTRCTHEDYGDGSCAECGGVCGVDYLHSFKDEICSVCGYVCGSDGIHSWKQGTCEACGKVCSHPEHNNGFCDICQYYEAPVDADGDNYYDIDNPGKLYWFSDQIASGNRSLNGELTMDIRINDRVFDALGNPPTDGTGLREWLPIGSDGNPFLGKFNGNNYTISGLYYCGDDLYTGLFGCIYAAEIRNIRLEDSYLFTDDTIAAGGIIGRSDQSTVQNCHNSAVVVTDGYGGGICANPTNSTNISYCSNAGSITAEDSAGGISGHGNATISYCENTGNITGGSSYADVGGISGWDGTISYCSNTGTISGLGNSDIGGIAGITAYQITSCYHFGKVVCSDSTSDVGLILGSCNSSDTSVSLCWYLLDDSGFPGVGYISEQFIQATGATAEQFASGEVCYKLNNSYNAGNWKQTLGYDAAPRITGEDVYYVSASLCTGNLTMVYSNSKNSVSSVHTDENKDHLCEDCGEAASVCNDLNNDHNCDICGTELTSHSGVATCVSPAVCVICGERFGSIDENNHSFTQSGGCSLCGLQAVASVLDASTDPAQYFMTLEEALAYAANINDPTIRIHSDVQIDGDVDVDTLIVYEGVTVTVNGNLNTGGLNSEGSWAGDGFVKNDATVYKVYNNKLYLLAGEAGADWEIWNVEEPTYWTAGEGYAAFDPDSSVLDLHNATINPTMSSSDDGCVCYDKDLTINFSGTGTLTANNHTSSRVFDIDGTTTMNGIGDDAQLYINGGSTDSEVMASYFKSLEVNSGTITFTGGNGTASLGLSIAESLCIAEGAVVNAHGGDAAIYHSLGVMAAELTVDGTLNATSGACGSDANGYLTTDILCTSITAAGTVNGVHLSIDQENMKLYFTVCGNAVMDNDRTAYAEEGITTTFTVPEGTTLTIGEDVTLDLSALKVEDVIFNGTVVNNGTILLPADATRSDAPKNGLVTIGENTFKWDGEAWYCGSESQHTGGTATCVECAVCDLCGSQYGSIDYDNHTGDTYVEYRWYPGEDNTCYADATLYCSGCNGYLDAAGGDCELVQNVPATDCMHSGHMTFLFICFINDTEYTEIYNIEVLSQNHVGQFENGFCSACGGYQKPDMDPGEDPEWDYDDVYLIGNAGQLYWFADHVNNVNNGAAAKLTADIDLNPGYTFYADGTYTGGDAPRTWTPIGMGYPCYAGNFDGNNKVISGAYCVSEGRYVGIFGNTDYNYTICNLGVSNSYFAAADHVGGLIGYAYTTVNNCYVTDTVYVNGEYSVGGLLGYNGVEINNCLALNGSLVGDNLGTCTNSYFLSDTEDEIEGTTAVTAEALASGEVAFLLQSGVVGEEIYDEETGEYVTAEPKHIWGQQIGTDPHPVLDGAKVYEGYAYCDVMGYTNDPESKPQPHNYIDGVCNPCGKVCTHTEPVDGLCPNCGLKLYKVSIDNNLSTGLEIVEGFYAAEGKDYVGKVQVLNDTVPSSDFLMWLTVGGEYFGNYSMQAGVLEIAAEYVTGDILFTGDGELFRADVDYTCFDYLMGDLTPIDVQWAEDYTKATFTYTCSLCEERQTRTLDTVAEVITPENCTEDGVLRHCARYGEVVRYMDVTIPADSSKHNFDQVTGNCSICGEAMAEASVTLNDAVTYYLTAQEAVDAAEAGTEETPALVTILKANQAPAVEILPPVDDIPGIYEYFWLIETGVMTIDFNGIVMPGPFQIGSDSVQLCDAVVTFCDNSEEKTGGISGIRNYGGTVIINSGNIHSVDGYAINSRYGNVTINGGDIYGGIDAVRSSALTTINGGTISGNEIAIHLYVNQGQSAVEGTSINGGTIIGGMYELYIDTKHTPTLDINPETGIGACFSHGLTVRTGFEAQALLVNGTAFWTEDSMLDFVDGSDISGYGPVTVQKRCYHKDNTNQWHSMIGSNYHVMICSVCHMGLEELHQWQPATCETPEICTVCGAIGEDAPGHSVGEPYCTIPATCSVCKEIIAPPLGHQDSNEDGQCDYCANAAPQAELCFTTISLEGNIAINYYMLLNDTVMHDGGYMQFTMANGDVIEVPVSEAVATELDGVTYHVFTCSVAAKEMTDNVISQFFYNYDHNSTAEYTYNVQTYAKHILETSSNEKTIALITAMLHYGAAAQNYFGYNTDNLANAGLTEVDYSAVTMGSYGAPAVRGTDLVKVCAATLIMNSENDLRFYFESSAESFTVTCNGQVLEIKQYGDLFYADVIGIAAKDLDDAVTITIDDGTTTADVTYSPMAYCASMVNKGTTNQQMKNLACALYLYNQAANAYFAEN